jgi:serine/threonine protein kinase
MIQEYLKDKNNRDIFTPNESDELGEGSFGTVYQGCYKNEPVAIKMMKGLPKNPKLVPSQQKRIEREIMILASCNHVNIIRFLGYSFESMMIITELALSRMHELMYGFREDILPLDQITSSLKLSWLFDILSGLSYLHFHEIIHRDLKPQNILICGNKTMNTKFIAKITDFGESTMAGLSSSYG